MDKEDKTIKVLMLLMFFLLGFLVGMLLMKIQINNKDCFDKDVGMKKSFHFLNIENCGTRNFYPNERCWLYDNQSNIHSILPTNNWMYLRDKNIRFITMIANEEIINNNLSYIVEYNKNKTKVI